MGCEADRKDKGGVEISNMGWQDNKYVINVTSNSGVFTREAGDTGLAGFRHGGFELTSPHLSPC